MHQGYSMVESMYTHRYPYKPKQHFAYYHEYVDHHNDDESLYQNFEIDQSPRQSLTDHYLSPSISPQNNEELLLPNDIKPEINLTENHSNAVSSPKTKHECVVCGDISSGFHYGVYTCEGCKGFFRRSLHQETSYLCRGSNDCIITVSSRNSCQYCRLKKCIDVGMSRVGSRLGRPPKRTHSEMILIDHNNTDANDHLSDSMGLKRLKSTFPECLFQDNLNIFIPKIHQEIQRKLSSMLIYQERVLKSIEINELNHLSEVIINAHRQFCPNTIEKIQMKIKEYSPILANPFAHNTEHNSVLIYSNWQRSFPYRSFREIFRSYPFYSQISKDDQICLLRYGIFETLLVSWFGFFDVEQRLMLTPDFSTYMNRDFIKTMKILGLFMLEIFDLGIKANHFKWTDDGIALFSALLLMNPERPGLSDKSRIEQIETKLMQVFYRHIRQEHPNKKTLFLNIIQLIPSIQEISKLHLNAIKYIKMYERRIFNTLPDFHREIYAGLWS